MISKVVKKQKNRKKLFWFLFLVPIIWIFFSGMWPSVSLKETKVISSERREMEMRSPTRSFPSPPASADIRRDTAEKEKIESDERLIHPKYWLFIDECITRFKDMWPIIISFLAYLGRKKIVGDDK